MPPQTADAILRRLEAITKALASDTGKYNERATLNIARVKRTQQIIKEVVGNGGSVTAGERAAKDETLFYWEELQTLEAEIQCLQEERDMLRLRLAHGI